MKALNTIVKSIGYFGIYLVALLNGYLITLMGIALLFSAVCTVWSFIAPLSTFIAENYGKITLLSAIPTGIIMSIYIMIHASPKSKKSKKQGNRNQ